MVKESPRSLPRWSVQARLVQLLAVLLLAGLLVTERARPVLLRIPAVHRRRQDQAERQAAAVEAQRYADEMSVAAVRAAETAERWRGHWERAEEQATAAWQAWQAAEERLSRTRAAAAFRSPKARRTTVEYASREQFLHRAVAKAVERGDLPATVMDDLAAGTGGWNPQLHPVEQELVLHRAIAAVRHHHYQQAVAAEQAAWHDAQLAVATRDSLRAEVHAAVEQAAAQREHLPEPELPAAPARPRWVQQTA